MTAVRYRLIVGTPERKVVEFEGEIATSALAGQPCDGATLLDWLAIQDATRTPVRITLGFDLAEQPPSFADEEPSGPATA